MLVVLLGPAVCPAAVAPGLAVSEMAASPVWPPTGDTFAATARE